MKAYYIEQAVSLMPYMAKWDFSEWTECEIKDLIRMYESN